MTSNPENPLLQLFYQHHLWSNLCLFDSCLTLTDDQLNHSDPGTYGSVRQTLIHLLRAEEYYLFFLTREERTAANSDDAQTPIAELKQRMRQSSTRLMQVALTIDPDNEVKVGEEEEAEMIPAKILLLQAIHHAHEHRTQIATLLGQQGIAPPSLSGWRYFDQVLNEK